MNLLVSFRSELLKTNRTASIYLCLVAAAIIPSLFLLEFSLGTLEPETLRDPWNAFFVGGLHGMGLIILPMYIMLTCTLLPQLEFRNNTWKQVLVSPQPKGHLFIAKFLTVHFYIFLLLLLFTGLMLAAAGAAQWMRPDVLLYSTKSNWARFSFTLFRLYGAIMGLCAFQFWLGLRFKHFMVPIAVGFALWMLTALLLFQYKWEHADMIPFAYPFLNSFPVSKSSPALLYCCSLGYAALFIILGFVDFKKKRVTA